MVDVSESIYLQQVKETIHIQRCFLEGRLGPCSYTLLGHCHVDFFFELS